jgi:hypothetical protein
MRKIIVTVAPVCHVGKEIPAECKNPLTPEEIAEDTSPIRHQTSDITHQPSAISPPPSSSARRRRCPRPSAASATSPYSTVPS